MKASDPDVLNVLREWDLAQAIASSQHTAAEISKARDTCRDGAKGLQGSLGEGADARRVLRGLRDLAADYDRVRRAMHTLARTQEQTRKAVREYLEAQER